MSFKFLISELMGFGLSEKEGEIYLANLSLGSTSVQNISKKANINRVTTYAMIDQLTKKGLISCTTLGKKKVYIPQPPERLLAMLREREVALQDHIARFDTVFRELQAIIGASRDRPIVRFYEGVEGLKALHHEVFTRKFTKVCQMNVPALSRNLFPPGASRGRDVMHERFRKGEVHARTLSVGPDPARVERFKYLAHHEMRFISEVKYPFSFEFGVYGACTVLYLVKGDYMGILIEDEAIARNFELLFNF